MDEHVDEPELNLKLDDAGLVTVVAQDVATGTIRMVAHATPEAVQQTLRTRVATFFSRSRQTLWVKGETSGHTMRVHGVFADCDSDALVYLVEPNGPSCHTGAETCFFRRLDSSAEGTESALPVLAKLERELLARRDGADERSYTRSLLSAGAGKIGDKIREEAGELADAIDAETDERVVSEAADLVYHLMVGLLHRGIPRSRVEHELARRFGVSGIEEKLARPPKV